MSSCQSQEDEGPEIKRRNIKVEEHVSDNVKVSSAVVNVPDQCQVFKDFKLIKILREDSRLKLITLHGSVAEQDAVIVLERKPFDATSLEKCLPQTKTCEETLQNDIYSTFDLCSGGDTPDMKVTLIHPATQKHIDKYTDREPFIVHETPEMYMNVTLPCIKQSKFSFQWVYNILDKKTESERIIVEDPDPEVGFVMVPDMKWDRRNVESLYVVAIVHRRGLSSIRDLRQEHLPLLENILHKGQTGIRENFGVTPDKLRIYFHYQPSYYHLHVHFTHLKFEAPGTDALRAHLLQDVIDNIKMNSNFYSQKTLSYVIRERDQMYNMYKERGYFS